MRDTGQEQGNNKKVQIYEKIPEELNCQKWPGSQLVECEGPFEKSNGRERGAVGGSRGEDAKSLKSEILVGGRVSLTQKVGTRLQSGREKGPDSSFIFSTIK